MVMTLHSDHVEKLIESTVSIPTMPASLQEIDGILNSSSANASDAWRIVERDPPLAAQILRLANSSASGAKQPISTVQVACSLMGLEAIRHSVVRAAALQILSGGGHTQVRELNLEWLWDHSLKTALAARLLAEAIPWSVGLTADEAYTCGLIHDVGKILLLEHYPYEVVRALRLSEQAAIPLAKAEMEIFGFCHAHVAGLLLRRWNLAPELQDAVMHHHGIGDTPEAWVRGFLVHAANGIAHDAADSNGGWRGHLADQDAMTLLGIPDNKLDSIRKSVRSVQSIRPAESGRSASRIDRSRASKRR